jgi:DnaK suppressor protein
MEIDAKEIRQRLEARRDELIAEGDIDFEPVRRDAVTSADEDEQPLTEMNQAIASRRNRARADTLAAIEHALEKLAESPDDFGLCEDCEEEIGERRLHALPHARLCIRCKGRRESDAMPGARRHLTDYQ